jgi:trehalose 2-sulfotransferase
LAAIHGRAHFILIERQDRLGQAMSRLIAWQNDRWTSQQQARVPDEALVYSRGAVEREMTAIMQETYALFCFFAHNGLAPMHVTYEAMIANPDATLDAIAAWLQRGPLQADLSKIGITRQANHINAAWRQRYLAGD